MNTQDHISQAYNDELEEVRSKVLTMGGLVEDHFQGATRRYLKVTLNWQVILQNMTIR
jgi:phosphate transport system protein